MTFFETVEQALALDHRCTVERRIIGSDAPWFITCGSCGPIHRFPHGNPVTAVHIADRHAEKHSLPPFRPSDQPIDYGDVHALPTGDDG